MIKNDQHLVKLRQVNGVNANLINNQQLIQCQHPGRYGLAVLVPFYSGKPCTIHLEIRPQNPSQSFRLEAHGSVSRMQKAYLDLDAAGNCTSVGEEIKTVNCQFDGLVIAIDFTFIPHHTREEWLYVFCMEGTASSQFEIDRLEFCTATPDFQNPQGTHFFVHTSAAYENYLQIDFELVNHNTRLTGLRLHGPQPFETVQWWTWQVPEPTDLPANHWLTARQPKNAIASPRAMDKYGTEFAWHGHSIRALYANFMQVTNMSTEESERMLSGLRLEAAFADGSTQIFEPRCYDETVYPVAMPYIEQAIGAAYPNKPTFLELGARGASSGDLRKRLETRVNYLGVDLHPDPNVDIVADAHHLSSIIERATIDLVYSQSVLEHILVPWKVVLECNRILRKGGLFIAHVPVSWALHAEPWDYWRISPHAWPALLNRHTGFEIVQTSEIGNAAIIPLNHHVGGLSRMPYDPAPIYSMVVARKIGEASAEWSGYSRDLANGRYDP